MPREIPPTAGLPLQGADLLPGPGDLAQAAGAWLSLPTPQLECSGTAALVVVLSALAQQCSRRTVIVPAYTCPLVAWAVVHCGLQVRVCDLAPDSVDLDTEQLRQLIDDDTLAVVPTHLGGRVADVGAVIGIARSRGVFVVEDAAQALGATCRGQSVGMQGDAGFFSLAAGKGLSIFEGGLLVSARDDLRAHFREWSDERIPDSARRELQRTLELLGYWAFYRPRGLHFVYGEPLRRALDQDDPVGAVGDRFSASIPLHRVGHWRQSIGRHALTRLPAFIEKTKQQAFARRRRLLDMGLVVPGDRPNEQGVWPFLMVLLPTAAQRDAVLDRLWRSGRGVSRLFIHVLPDYPELRAVVPDADVPNARDLAARMLTISNSPWMDETSFAMVCDVLGEAMGAGRPGAVTITA